MKILSGIEAENSCNDPSGVDIKGGVVKGCSEDQAEKKKSQPRFEGRGILGTLSCTDVGGMRKGRK